MRDAVKRGSYRARHTTRGRRSEVRLGRAPMGSEVRNWRVAKTRRATSSISNSAGKSEPPTGQVPARQADGRWDGAEELGTARGNRSAASIERRSGLGTGAGTREAV